MCKSQKVTHAHACTNTHTHSFTNTHTHRSTSLCSVYQLLKCGRCPYFYLCANQFTVLFAAAGVRGCPSISAIITPTTSGMRDALRKEGIYMHKSAKNRWITFLFSMAALLSTFSLSGSLDRGRAESPPGTSRGSGGRRGGVQRLGRGRGYLVD